NEGAALEAGEHPFDRAAFFGGARLLGERLAVDADGKRTDLHPAAIDLAPIAIGTPARVGGHDAVAEISGIGLGLKPNDIIGAETPENPLVGGQGACHIRPRPRNVMEKTNAVFAAQLTQKTPHRNEMI